MYVRQFLTPTLAATTASVTKNELDKNPERLLKLGRMNALCSRLTALWRYINFILLLL